MHGAGPEYRVWRKKKQKSTIDKEKLSFIGCGVDAVVVNANVVDADRGAAASMQTEVSQTEAQRNPWNLSWKEWTK
jgi:hypothetical protein